MQQNKQYSFKELFNDHSLMILLSTCNLQHSVFGDINQTQMTIGEDAQHCK